MRASTLLALSGYALTGAVRAQDADMSDTASSIMAEAAKSKSAAEATATDAFLPKFTPTTLKAPFLEQFTDDWEERWKPSHAKKENTEEEWQYVGTWSAEEPLIYKGIAGDKGLVLKDKAAHHAISARFPEPIDNKDKTLVVQYEVKLQTFLECGGAYMKLLQQNAALESQEFSNASPYIIMFGPDKCGSTNKVHFIFRHKNPKTGEYEEKHLDAAPAATITKVSTLYTLIIRPDQTFEILIDGTSSKNGSLLENFTPAVNPPKEIEDPEDMKPADWVDEAKIEDATATKPADWDETEPYEIADPDATKPDDWLDDEPLTVPDTDVEKPEDWDDEEDGTWVAPSVHNAKCDEVSGCGPWSPPMIKNPKYKGKWNPPMIDNPAYKGEWAPRHIPNPAFFEDLRPSDLEPMGAIGFELWTMNEDILFDNIYIGHSVEDAQAFKKATYDIKKPNEVKAEESARTVDDTGKGKKQVKDLVFLDDPALFIREKVKLFVELVQKNPIEAIKFVPEVSGAILIGILTVLVVVISASSGAAPSAADVKAAAQKAKDQAQKTKDDVANAVASGADQAKDELNKRTTRSSAQ